MKNKINLVRKLIYYLIPVIYGIGWIFSFKSGIEENSFNELYLSLWERGLSGFFLIVYLMCSFQFCVMDEYNLFYERTIRFIVTRIGMRRHVARSMLRIFISSVLFALLVHASIIVGAYTLGSFDFSARLVDVPHVYFSNNLYVNVGTFVCLSSLGAGVLNASLYPFYCLVKNRYVIQLFPVLVFFGTLIMAAMYGAAIKGIFGNTELVATLCLSPLPSSLIEPGCGWYSYAFIDFLAGVGFYVLFGIIGMMIVNRREALYDW